MLVKNYRPAGVGMVPAEPGTYMLHAYFDGDQIDVVKSNVIGWQVINGRSLTPLVIDPRAAEVEPWYVTHPDGRVECSDGRCWDGLEQWLDDERRPSPQPSEDHITAAMPPRRTAEQPAPQPDPGFVEPEPLPMPRMVQNL